MHRITYYVGLASDIFPDLGPGALTVRAIQALESHNVQGATLTPGIGIWDGTAEPSLTITILSEGSAPAFDPASLAKTLATYCGHHVVIGTCDTVSHYFSASADETHSTDIPDASPELQSAAIIRELSEVSGPSSAACRSGAID